MGCRSSKNIDDEHIKPRKSKVKQSKFRSPLFFHKSSNSSQSSSASLSKYCPTCDQPYTQRSPRNWCQPCEARRFQTDFPNWTTGNLSLDAVIQYTQLHSTGPNKFLEWIPYDRFENIKEIGRGGFGVVYSALWDLGPKLYWHPKKRTWIREGEVRVKLKKLVGSADAKLEYWVQMERHRCHQSQYVPHWYGYTRDPISKDYIIVTVLPDYTLHQYIEEHFNQLTWERRAGIVYNIAHALMDIHNLKLIHGNLHSGNVLRDCNGSQGFTYITDVGNYSPPTKENEWAITFADLPFLSSPEPLYGVLPYTAPELLHGAPRTEHSDVYSFGMIMYEIAAGVPPFSFRAHNHALAADVCRGLRPEIPVNTPKCYVKLMIQCLDADPSRRPNIREIEKTLMSWGWHMGLNQNQAVERQFVVAEKMRVKALEEEKSRLRYIGGELNKRRICPEAVYTSRKLEFKNLPEIVRVEYDYDEEEEYVDDGEDYAKEFVDDGEDYADEKFSMEEMDSTRNEAEELRKLVTKSGIGGNKEVDSYIDRGSNEMSSLSTFFAETLAKAFEGRDLQLGVYGRSSYRSIDNNLYLNFNQFDSENQKSFLPRSETDRGFI
ncbi:3139_t:CDS:2 [Paraglomus occultum]|uniref:3139_t:CDS:1 n=1 Tax=Paraglomus occultum TaxID=144539 RepID=A0A9N9BLX6_9GLOM|nr:3139_t:CDS:2 [Paraglomus occultum]